MARSSESAGKAQAATAGTTSPPARPPFNLKSYGLSERGQVRSSNQDCFLVAELARRLLVHHTNLPQSEAVFSCHRGHVFLVADGVGGSKAGDVASGLTVGTIEGYLLNTLKRFSNLHASEEQAALRELQNALLQADSRIFEETAKHPEWRGMGTTLTLAFAVNWRLFVAHAGDSRCYLLTGGRLQRLTEDHTITHELVRQGIVSPERQANHPWRHVVTNLLGGMERGVRAELHSLDLHGGDVLLLCSDGLTELVAEPTIADILHGEPDPQRACERLVNEANNRGGKDNITVVVAHVQPTEPTRVGS